MKHANQQSGFTLIEVIVVLAVLAILAAIAIPAMNSQLSERQLKSAVSTLSSQLNAQRAAAMTSRQDQTINVGVDTNQITWSRRPSGSLPETLTYSPQGGLSFGTADQPTQVTYTATSSNGKTMQLLVSRTGKAEVRK